MAIVQAALFLQAGGDPVEGEIGPRLTKLGKLQASRVGKRLADEKFCKIYCSDMIRARMTAEAIRKHHRETPFKVDPRIREIDWDHIGPPLNCKTRKARRELKAITAFCDEIILRHKPGQRVLIVAHGNIIRLMFALFFHADPHQQIFLRIYNTSVSLLVHQKKPYVEQRLILVDCLNHLAPHQVTN